MSERTGLRLEHIEIKPKLPESPADGRKKTPPKKLVTRILAIGPHPDDVEFGCAGTLYKYASRGHHVSMLLLSRGDVGGDPEIRISEQIRSCEIMGIRDLYIAGYEDTRIPVSKEVVTDIETVIRKVQAHWVFVPYWSDTHQDHRATAECVLSASRYVKNVLTFEVPSTLHFDPDVFVDITDVMAAKNRALRAHASQVLKTNIADLSILECAESTAIFRGVQGKVRFAEAFKAVRLFINI